MTSFSPSRRFTIQNVDFMSCLEMSVRPINKPVSARPWKDNEKQRWKLILVPDSEEEYYIYNEAQKTYLGVLSETDKRLASKSRANACKWIFYPVGRSPTSSPNYEIVLSGEETDTCLQLGEFGNPYIADRDDSEAQQWRIFAGTPSSPAPRYSAPLEEGFYRIRNLDGHSILTFSDAEASTDSEASSKYTTAQVSEQDSDNDHQRFYVKPWEGDGQQYTIQSSTHRGEFLGVDKTQLVKFGTVRGLSKEFYWEIESIGGFAFTMSVKCVQGSLSPGFASQADVGGDSWNKVVMLPTNSNHSQTWLFERWEKLPNDVSYSPSSSLNWLSGPGYRTIFDTNGWYNLCSVSIPSHYLHLNGAYGAPHTHPCDVNYMKVYGSFYFVKRGNYFIIKDRNGAAFYAYVPSTTDTALNRTQVEAEASLWYIRQDKVNKQHFRLCLYEPTKKKGDPVRVLGNTGVNASGNFRYTIPIAAYAEGASNQLWSLQ